MKNFYKLFLVIAFFGLIGSTLTSCGRYSEPSPIENSGFPHRYPQH